MIGILAGFRTAVSCRSQAILGHSHFDTTMSVHTHAALQAQREALDRVGALLAADVSDAGS
ncbi:hypothetical protein [Streptomyces atratus]|nr:hypothetical protein GCM10010207_42740 [Streptomyces atratus]